MIAAHVSPRDINGSIVYSIPNNLWTERFMTECGIVGKGNEQKIFSNNDTKGRLCSLDMGSCCGV